MFFYIKLDVYELYIYIYIYIYISVIKIAMLLMLEMQVYCRYVMQFMKFCVPLMSLAVLSLKYSMLQSLDGRCFL